MAASNVNRQESLTNFTDQLVAATIAVREQLEMAIDDWQNAQEAQDEAARDMDQIALVTTKNELWKDMSWIIRQTYAQTGQEKHGYSAGPVYGLVNSYAQTSSNGKGGPVEADPDNREQYGFGAEGTDDNYNPYGYGDFGFGYGYGQFQFKEVQEKLNAMVAAQQLLLDQNDYRIANSLGALNALLE